MTYSSRRNFVGGMVILSGTGVAGCSGGSGSVVSPISSATPTPTATGPVLTAAEPSDWDKFVGTAFTITSDSGSKISATLTRLERIADASRPATLARHQPFYASFETASGQAPVGGKTYTLSHASKGDFDLFLGLSSMVSGKSVITALLN